MITIESNNVIINSVSIKVLISNFDANFDNTCSITYKHGYTGVNYTIPYTYNCENNWVELILDLTGLPLNEDYNMIIENPTKIIYIEKIKLN